MARQKAGKTREENLHQLVREYWQSIQPENQETAGPKATPRLRGLGRKMKEGLKNEKSNQDRFTPSHS